MWCLGMQLMGGPGSAGFMVRLRLEVLPSLIFMIVSGILMSLMPALV